MENHNIIIIIIIAIIMKFIFPMILVRQSTGKLSTLTGVYIMVVVEGNNNMHIMEETHTNSYSNYNKRNYTNDKS
jgi:hypothetical protein